MTKSLVDSNILIYSVQATAGKRHEIASKFISSKIDSDSFIISAQNLAEFSRILLEKSEISIDSDVVYKYAEGLAAFATVLEYTCNDVLSAIEISKEYKIHFFDALLVATMKQNNIGEIVTENTKDFLKIPGLIVTNPFK